MFSFLSFAVLVIGAIGESDGLNNFEIRHSIELGSNNAEGIDAKEIENEVKEELYELICTGYDGIVNDCSIEGMTNIK